MSKLGMCTIMMINLSIIFVFISIRETDKAVVRQAEEIRRLHSLVMARGQQGYSMPPVQFQPIPVYRSGVFDPSSLMLEEEK